MDTRNAKCEPRAIAKDSQNPIFIFIRIIVKLKRSNFVPDSYIKKLIEKSKKEFAIEKYREADITMTHQSFIGTLKKHPHDTTIIILLTNPFVANNEFYEFTIASISFIEELGTITNEDGESAMKVKVWVKKGVPAIKAKPFIIR